MGLRDKIVAGLPWIEPILDYFDWRKQVITFVAAVAVAVWSFMKDLPAPVIFVLALATLVHIAYAFVLPGLVRLVHVGVRTRPNYAIWQHKNEFALVQAAYLLADQDPSWDMTLLGGDAAAWFEVLREAIQKKELAYVPTLQDRSHTDLTGKFSPPADTAIPAADLKKFCAARGRYPEFLR